MSRALTPEMAAEFARVFKSLGFKFVTLDLEGFRSGSMNALLTTDQISAAEHRPTKASARRDPAEFASSQGSADGLL